jgi:hypothetical protein
MGKQAMVNSDLQSESERDAKLENRPRALD